MRTDPFQSCGLCWVFQIYWHMECSTLKTSSFRIWNSSVGISSPPLALFIVMLPKTYLTSHSKMSNSRWVITPSWLSLSFFYFLFLLFQFFFFNWRIVAVENFVVFCHASMRISCRFTLVPSLPTSLPSPSPSHHSACHRAPIWVPWVTQQIHFGYLSICFTYGIVNFHYSLHTSPLFPPLLLLYP